MKKFFCFFFILTMTTTAFASVPKPAVYGKVLLSQTTPVTVSDTVSYGNDSWENYSVQFTITLSGKSAFDNQSHTLLYFRSLRPGSGYAMRINDVHSGLSFYRVDEGTFTWLDSYPKLLAPDESLSLHIDLYEDKITVFVATGTYPYFQQPAIQITDPSYPKGGILFTKPAVYSDMVLEQVFVKELLQNRSFGERAQPQNLAQHTPNPFSAWTDCIFSPYSGAIRYLASLGIVSGMFENAFYPEKPIREKEWITLLVRLKGIPVEENPSDWAAPYVNAAISHGLITSTSFSDLDGTVSAAAAADLLNLPPPSQDHILTRGEACQLAAAVLDPFFLSRPGQVQMSLVEYPHAFSNPMKGFRGSPGDEYATLVHHNIPWNAIESSSNDGVEKITVYCDSLWADYPQQNIKAIPRVILQFNDASYWPEDMQKGDFSSAQFISRVKALVEKLGQAWDQDPRVAFVQMGIIGNWGEMQNPYPTAQVQQALLASFEAAFPNKLVQTNFLLQNSLLAAGKFGWYWDSFGHWDNLGVLDGCPRVQWKTVPFGGETAFDWGDSLGSDPDDALLSHGKRYAQLIRYSHATYLGWISRYTQDDPQVAPMAELIQKTLGYRFVLTGAAYRAQADSGQNADLTLRVINSGSAPFYYDWPLDIALLDKDTHQVLWHTQKSCGINSWVPGENGKEIVYTVPLTFSVPDLPSGTYILAVAVAEPDGSVPSLRFANLNYYSGGYTPLGRFSIGTENKEPLITQGFDDLKADRLSYDVS